MFPKICRSFYLLTDMLLYRFLYQQRAMMMPVFQNIQNNIASVGQLVQVRTYYNDTDAFQCPKLQSAVKQPRQTHTFLLIIYIVLLVILLLGIILVVSNIMMPSYIGQMMAAPVFIYFVFTICLEPHKLYLKNMKDVNGINQIYEELKVRTGHLKLIAECFHYTNSGKSRKRVVTHTAIEMIPVRACVDQSENLSTLNYQQDKYLFCKVNKCFYFGDTNSQAMFMDVLSRFKTLNTRDTHQTWSHVLDITTPGFENEIGVCASGTGSHLRPLFFIFTILGLGYPYLMAVECNVARYQINSIKRLTL